MCRTRRFVTEVPTPGCSLVYGAGPRRFLMLCANGGALVSLDDQGNAATPVRTDPFFDAQKDPVTEKAVRRGDDWLFVSYDGVVHPVDVSGDPVRFGDTWPLLDDQDRAGSWRIGGGQLLAVHQASGRLYVLMHQGGPDSHKEPGTEVWVYDLASRKRVQRVSIANPLIASSALQASLDSAHASGRIERWLLGKLVGNPGVERILVTQDEHPVLVASASIPPTLTVHDAMTGDVLREVSEPGLGGGLLFAP